MTDQCKHCTVRGDMEACAALECGIHESWYAESLANEIERLRQQRDELLSALKKLTDDCMASDFNEHWSAFIEAEEAITKAKERK